MPDWNEIVREHVASLHVAGGDEVELTEELAQHLEDRYHDLRNSGATEEQARGRVLSELADVAPLRQAPVPEPISPGSRGSGNFIEDLWRDLRFGARAIGKVPGFALFVVLTLALGIGANTTIFAVINTLILNPIPVQHSSTLAAVHSVKPKNASNSTAPLPLSYADLKDYKTANQVFSAFAGYASPRGVTWESGGASQGMFVELVTSEYFPTLGIQPARGRFFSPEEDSAPGAHPVAVLNYGTWQARFAGASDIVGKALRLNKIVFTVIGVAPPNFIGLNAIFGPDLWIPAAMTEALLPNQMQAALGDRGKAAFYGVGRLKPGITRMRAQINMSAIASRLAREYPATDEGHGIAVRPIRDILFASSTGSSSPIVFAGAILLVVVGIVLLIACSNVANLLLARSAARQQEVAVRLAVGASRSRLVRQLLTESILLGMLSGAAGLLMAYAALQLLFGALPASANFISPKIDSTVFAFALLVSVATGVIFGVVPALSATRVDVAEGLKEESRTAGRSRKKISVANALLVVQVAFSFLLLVTATLFLRSIQRAYDIDPGFQTAHLAVFTTSPGQAGYSRQQTYAFYKDVLERVARVPGVTSVSWASNMPLWARPVNGLKIEGREQRSRGDAVASIVNTVAPGYFETAGVRIESGRAFQKIDQETSTPVAIINQKMAHDYWPDGRALGRRIQLPGEKQMREIVGIARTAVYSAWGEPPQACAYVPLEQNYSDAMDLYVRSQGNPQQILVPVRSEIKAAGPPVLIGGPLSGREIIDRGLFQARIGVTLLSVFGLLALGLASIGLYCILAYSVTQRKREIGLRMALGAARTAVLRLVLRQGMSLVLIGLGAGLTASLGVARLLRRMLYGVSGVDPVSVAAASAVLLVIALLACYVPARRASRVDPLIALREL